jgi:hypothetical protein
MQENLRNKSILHYLSSHPKDKLNIFHNIKFEDFTAVTIKITVIWDVSLCCVTEIYKHSISKELTISDFKVENAFHNVLFVSYKKFT